MASPSLSRPSGLRGAPSLRTTRAFPLPATLLLMRPASMNWVKQNPSERPNLTKTSGQEASAQLEERCPSTNSAGGPRRASTLPKDPRRRLAAPASNLHARLEQIAAIPQAQLVDDGFDLHKRVIQVLSRVASRNAEAASHEEQGRCGKANDDHGELRTGQVRIREARVSHGHGRDTRTPASRASLLKAAHLAGWYSSIGTTGEPSSPSTSAPIRCRRSRK